jgi:hypothetical protein
MDSSMKSFWKVTFAWTVAVFILAAVQVRAQSTDEHLDTFRVGTTVYTNVTIMTKTPTDIFFKHSFGFGNTKVMDVDRHTLLSLGYQLPPDESEKKSALSESAQEMLESETVTNLVADPRFQEAQALLNAQIGESIEKFTPQLMYGIVGGFIAFYLFFSFCCRQICVKTGQAASPLIWLPILKQIPLLRAAGIPVWLFVPGLLLAPVAFPLLQIWWSFKITAARGKHWIVGVLLILPITNVLAFLYLAFSGTGAPEAPTSNVISLGGPPKRAAA